ncbi:MAG: hypothetical protein AAFZ15_05950 [Bacteroidota bacterium]
MRQTIYLYWALLFWMGAMFSSSCYSGNKSNGQTVLVSSNETDNEFSGYWYSGEGELNTYDLEQLRYGEMRQGEAVMVFVTEPFDKEKQVKLDNPDLEGAEKVSVMKLNHIRRFSTGVYDYSMMQSVFTPIDLNKRTSTLKTTTTSQDWCGHSFHQMNKEGDKYRSTGFSYFESEGDEVKKLQADLLEDELWTQIRINPELLQKGNYNVVPATFYSRLAHDPLKAKQARIRKEKKGVSNLLILEYLHLDRTLTIEYTSSFPHKIIAWTELQNGRTMSKGILKASVKSAYWRENGNRHGYLRDSLGL